MQHSIRIGTSGWNYDGWKGSLYPEKLSAAKMLAAYCETFDTVEINNTFYSLPTEKAVQNWYETTPKNFLFAVKASRFITHNKKLKDPESSIRLFFSRVEILQEKIGPVLFQLPPRWRVNAERLEEFLQALPKGHLYTFEFREPSWLCDPVYDILRKYNANLCFYDFKQFQPPDIVTSDFIYCACTGLRKKPMADHISSQALQNYVHKIKDWKAKKTFCYFDNDQKARAPHDAKRLLDQLAGRG